MQPITLNYWLNYAVHHWDEFVAKNSQKFIYFEENPDLFTFLKKTADSFINYRILSNYIDATQLDLDSVAYDNKILINAFIYLVMSTNVENLQKCKFYNEDSEATILNHNKNNSFDEIFNEFLINEMNTNLDEIATALNYSMLFSKIPINFDVMAENFDKTITFDFNVNIYFFENILNSFCRRIIITIYPSKYLMKNPLTLLGASKNFHKEKRNFLQLFK